MKIKVRLLGLLSKDVKSYDAVNGIEIDMPQGAMYEEIIAVLSLPPEKAGMFSVGGILKKRDEVVVEGDEVNIFMPLAGG